MKCMVFLLDALIMLVAGCESQPQNESSTPEKGRRKEASPSAAAEPKQEVSPTQSGPQGVTPTQQKPQGTPTQSGPQGESHLKGSSTKKGNKEKPVPHAASTSTLTPKEQMVRGINTMGAKLFTAITKKRDKGAKGAALANASRNVVISSYSIASAFMLAWVGARGKTEQEFARFFSSTLPTPQQHKVMGRLMQSLKSATKVKLKVANSLWLERTLPLEENYLKNTKAWYQAVPFRADFKKNPKRVTKRINRWVSQKTNSKIPKILPVNALKPRHRAVLVNAIWFLGKWADPFKKSRTKSMPFYPDSEHEVLVKTMNRKGMYPYSKNHHGEVLLEIPYKGNRFSFVVYLPRTSFASFDLRSVRARFPKPIRTRILLSFPRMKLKQGFRLGKLLKTFLPTAFSNGADFSGITTSKNGLAMDEVFHNTFIKADEEGTEASAATAVTMGKRSIAPRFQQVKINRPFLFWIVDGDTGLVLFTGRIVNPDPKAKIASVAK